MQKSVFALVAAAHAVLVVSVTCIAGFDTPPSQQSHMEVDWPMFMRDPGHTGESAEQLSPPLCQVWRLPLGQSACPPIVANSTVYVGTTAGEFLAVNVPDGKIKWKAKAGGPLCYAAAAGDGRVFVGSLDSNLYAFDADSGRPVWQYSTGGQIWSSPILADGTVYVGSNDRKCHAVQASTGTAKWTADLGSPVWSSPAAEGDRVFVLTHNGMLWALNRSNGQTLWRHDTMGESLNSSPSVRSGVVYVAVSPRRLDAESGIGREPCASSKGKNMVLALNSADGTVLWAGGEEKSFYWATPVVGERVVCVQGTGPGGFGNFWGRDMADAAFWSFLVLDRATGKAVAPASNVFELHGYMMNPLQGWAAGALAGRYLFSSGGMLDLTTMKLVGRVSGPASPKGGRDDSQMGGSAPAVSDGMVFVTIIARTSELVCYRAK